MLSDEGVRWWFDSGSVALDFAYAGGFGETPESLLSPEALGSWLATRYPEVAQAASEGDLRDARALQSALARAVVAQSQNEPADAADIDVINLFAATPDIPPSLDGGSRQAGRTRARPAQALSAIARDSIELFAPGNTDRIRQCAADDCDLIFYDESRSNNRRWCSMQRCGNRAKVRAHRARA
jgi:predicted RNA-binding Zn ribbon-like protein